MKTVVQEIVSRHITTKRGGMPHVHYHNLHELYYMAKGSTTYYIGDKIYHVEKGNFVFIPKGVLHKTDYEYNDNNERVLLSFGDILFSNELQEVREELYNSRVIYVQEEQLPYFEKLLQQIETEYHREDGYSSLMMNLYITELLVQLCRYKYSFKPVLSGTDRAIYAISKYISLHFQENISLAVLSYEFGMSESHLSRKFKAHTGIGINEYITYVRTTNAEKLLRETELSVTEVADQCGYSDSNYFSTVFKRIKGITPQKCRKLG
jgi:AraC-like DNA-binding protein